jgi:hypothetical protein
LNSLRVVIPVPSRSPHYAASVLYSPSLLH